MAQGGGTAPSADLSLCQLEPSLPSLPLGPDGSLDHSRIGSPTASSDLFNCQPRGTSLSSGEVKLSSTLHLRTRPQAPPCSAHTGHMVLTHHPTMGVDLGLGALAGFTSVSSSILAPSA